MRGAGSGAKFLTERRAEVRTIRCYLRVPGLEFTEDGDPNSCCASGKFGGGTWKIMAIVRGREAARMTVGERSFLKLAGDQHSIALQKVSERISLSKTRAK